jgi:hypothetical protein
MTTYFADGREALIRVHCDGWHDLAAFFAGDAERFTAPGSVRNGGEIHCAATNLESPEVAPWLLPGGGHRFQLAGEH